MFFENLSPKARCRSIFLGSKWEWLPIFFVPLQSTMTRVFHHRLTPGELCGILLLALASLYCFWFGTWPMAVLGALLVAVAVRGIDRGIHTDYVLDDDQLTTQSGRIGRQRGQAIPLQTITALRRMPRHLLTGSYVMVEHGYHNISIFTPENEASFVEAVGKRVSLAKNTCQEKETES